MTEKHETPASVKAMFQEIENNDRQLVKTIFKNALRQVIAAIEEDDTDEALRILRGIVGDEP